MNIHEYQAKKILAQYGINIPEGGIAYTPTEAKRVAQQLSSRGPWMIKAQIPLIFSYLFSKSDDLKITF